MYALPRTIQEVLWVFKGAKQQLLECLASANVLHQERADINIKNLLAVGQISLEKVSDIIARADGGAYTASPHHLISNIEVHILKTRYKGQSWYIKWYFSGPNSVFISVHQ